MDPLSTISTVTSVISEASGLLKFLYQLIAKYRDLDKKIAQLQNELETFQGIAQSICDVAISKGNLNDYTLTTSFNRYRTTICQLNHKLRDCFDKSQNRRSNKITRFIRYLREDEEITALRQQLRNYERSMTTQLTILTYGGVNDMESGVKNVEAEVLNMKTELAAANELAERRHRKSDLRHRASVESMKSIHRKLDRQDAQRQPLFNTRLKSPSTSPFITESGTSSTNTAPQTFSHYTGPRTATGGYQPPPYFDPPPPYSHPQISRRNSNKRVHFEEPLSSTTHSASLKSKYLDSNQNFDNNQDFHSNQDFYSNQDFDSIQDFDLIQDLNNIQYPNSNAHHNNPSKETPFQHTAHNKPSRNSDYSHRPRKHSHGYSCWCKEPRPSFKNAFQQHSRPFFTPHIHNNYSKFSPGEVHERSRLRYRGCSRDSIGSLHSRYSLDSSEDSG
ncbi:hypothetical protein MMC10_000694 [Thelotrema lepadinum]|nr:hypothetical protein [Thelotrema lepadinum]